MGNKRLDFFFGWQLDMIFLHKQIRVQTSGCILDHRLAVVCAQEQAYGGIVICRHHFVLAVPIRRLPTAELRCFQIRRLPSAELYRVALMGNAGLVLSHSLAPRAPVAGSQRQIDRVSSLLLQSRLDILNISG